MRQFLFRQLQRGSAWLLAVLPALVAGLHVATAWPQDRRGCIPARPSPRLVLRYERKPERPGPR
ncbi:hypothetical protein [Bradyrhizobium prioriisuperbiae]|uniref:hypothetical protein n=1 Tax=Bradyrhizobium prioriisuperbiae TaxID=2854389 RepID=UPI0028E92E66|nr:hypothetical protein [Bradyrhizobium prioritasuperba]